MITSIISLNANSYSDFISTGGKLYIPVNKAVLIYSQLNHVSGVATQKGQKGVSINKITILNSLIDQLVKMKMRPEQNNTQDMTSDQIDNLIENYQEQIKTTIDTAKVPDIFAGVMPETGIIFNIQA